MGNKCILKNFKSSEDIVRFPEKISEASTVEETFTLLMEELGKPQRSFSIDISTSADPENFGDSMVDLINTTVDGLAEVKFKNPELTVEKGSNNAKRLKNMLRLQLAAKTRNDRDEELDIFVAIHPTESQEELRSRKLNESLSRFFKNNNHVKELFGTIMRERLAGATRISLDKQTLVTTVEELNLNIEQFLQDNFLTLIKYMESLGTGKSWGLKGNFTKNMFAGRHNIISTLNDYLDSFENLIEYKRRTGMLQEEVERGYNSYAYEDGQNTDFLEALFSFLTLKYFDDIIKDNTGKYISYDKNMSQPIEIDEDGLPKFKYTYGKDIEGRVSGWGVEARDALKELGNYSKFLIQLIRMVDLETGEVHKGEHMQVVDFFQTMTGIGANAYRFRPTPDMSDTTRGKFTALYNSITHIHENPIQNMRGVMTTFHNAIQTHNRGVSNTLYDVLSEVFNAYELKVLESVYRSVFSDSPDSMYSIEHKYNQSHGLSESYPIVETLVSQVLASTQMNYQGTYWSAEKKQYITDIKQKFNTDKMFFELLTSINLENQSNMNDNGYKLLGREKQNKQEIYDIDINGTHLRIYIPTQYGQNSMGLFSEVLESPEIKIIENDTEININNYLADLDVSLYKARRTVLESNTGVNKVIKDLLKFIDIYTGTSFSNEEEGLQKYHLISALKSNIISDMLTTAFKGFYVNKLNIDFTEAVTNGQYGVTDFAKYIYDNNLIFAKIESLKQGSDKWRAVWTNTSRGQNLVTVTSNTTWLKDYAKVLQMLSGEIAKANIKNAEGKSIPNYGLTFLGANPLELIESNALKNGVKNGERVPTALSDNPFFAYPEMIEKVAVDTDVTLRNGTRKLVKSMTNVELYYHSIVDKFFIPFMQGKMYVQPTTYSDKTKFINFLIDLKAGGRDLTKLPLPEFNNLIISSIGNMYKNILDKVIKDYTIVFPEIAEAEDKITAIENIIKNMTEDQLTAAFVAKNIKLETDIHFREINGGKLAFNELLIQYATETYTKEGLKKRLKKEKKTFVRNLLETLSTFSLVGENNPIAMAYQKMLGDDDTWKEIMTYGDKEGFGLIIAKDENGETIKTLEQLSLAKSIELNPMLERYLLLHTYLGNNLRYILTGNELNHKNKTLSKMNLGDRILSRAIQRGIIKDGDSLPQLLAVHPLLQTALEQRMVDTNMGGTIFDIWKSLSFNDLKFLATVVPGLKSLFDYVYNDSIYEVEATSQGAQLKRNVIIPGTMRPYTQNSLRGIPSTFRVAVVMDTKAATFNVNGDSKTGNDAHDGAAFINAITSILENWSLQENEVGDIKKPIWHDYNGDLGTATLVKFAAHALTNSMMRQAKGGINMLNIFKKMTNKSWEGIFSNPNILSYGAFQPSGFIDITTIVGDNTLYYRGKEGIVYSIKGIGYDESAQTYYTDEYVYDEGTGIESDLQRIYHYFTENGDHVKSVTPLNDPSLHKMHSIWEMYQTLGGVNSVQLVDGEIKDSEASLYATARFVNAVAIKSQQTLDEEQQYKKALTNYEKLKKEGKRPVKPKLQITLDQKHYTQPLKTMMVDYVCNNSAIKNGAGNRNNNARLYNDEAFDTIVLNTQYYGIQMDADHDADEAEMTEFSQVISALDAGGRLHDYVSSIYRALGDMAIRESQAEVNIIEAFQNALAIDGPVLDNFKATLGITGNIEEVFAKALDMPQNKAIEFLAKNIGGLTNKTAISKAFAKAKEDRQKQLSDARDKLYTIIGNTIINNMSTSRGQAGLTEAILSQIKKNFNLKSSHKLESEIKIPFSDPNIYSQMLSTFSSIMNRKSIRRQYPGTGGVLSPGYDIMMIYDLDGITYQYNDLLKRALDWYNTEEIPKDIQDILDNEQDDTKWNDKLVELYMQLQSDAYNADKFYYTELYTPELRERFVEEFKPLESVGFNYTIGGGTDLWYDFSLNKIEDYYAFKANPEAFISKLVGTTVTLKRLRRNINKPRNLAPTQVWWEYIDEAGNTRTKVIYDTDEVRNAFLNKDNSRVQALLDELVQGTYKGQKITLYNTPAEMIMANIYQSRFNIGADTSMVDVLNNAGHIFKDRPIKQTQDGIIRDFYDFVMIRANGRHSYISFDRSFQNTDENLVYRQLHWGKKLRQDSYEEGVVHDVYVLDDDEHKMFLIGRDIIRDDITYNASENNFYKDGEVIDGRNLTWDGEKVVEYVEFVTQHNYRTSNKNHTVYNINTKKLESTIRVKNADGRYTIAVDQKQGREYYYNLLEDQLRDMYQADSYECFTLNNQYYSRDNAHLVKRLMSKLHTRFSYDSELSSYIERLYEEVIKKNMIEPTNGKITLNTTSQSGLIVEDDKVKIGKGAYAGKVAELTKAYYKTLAKRKQTSFRRSLFYTASRIPAQTLQSFMQMKQVGYTGGGKNYVYVSHWQTWLQGSDYDIDKAYIMGLAFDDNGSYVGWSTLFDYTDEDTLRLSEKLPLPNSNKVIVEDPQSEIDINEELNHIASIDQTLKQGKSLNEKADRMLRLQLYLNIFDKLGNNTFVKTVTNKGALAALNKHFSTVYPPGQQSKILRNFISSHIQESIQHIRSLKDAYVPVDMEDLQDAAESSPKGQDAKTITLLNPLSIYKMQRQNMIGKNVIGISATGQKAAFMFTYYMNEAYKNAKEGVDYTYKTNDKGELVLDEQGLPQIEIISNSRLAQTMFEFHSERLVKNDTHTVSMIPDLNVEGVQEELKKYALTHKLSPSKPVDIMISQLISAATDNAKELILDKINAGEDLAKCFVFGIVMGCDVPTLVEFMTSPVLSWISTRAQVNAFNGQELTVKQAANEVEAYLNKKLNRLRGTSDENITLRPSILDTIIPTTMDATTIEQYLKDIKEFKNLIECADEFSTLGRTLSINQGLQTRAENLELVADNITNIIRTREEDLGLAENGVLIKQAFEKNVGSFARYKYVVGDNFDVLKWLQDRYITLDDGSRIKYRELTAEYYDKIKKTINIFSVINTLPHFSKMFELMGTVFTVHSFPVRTRIVQEAVKQYKAINPRQIVDLAGYSQILGAANELLLIKFFENSNIKFPVRAGQTLINANGHPHKVGSAGGKVDLSTDAGRAAFKQLFEDQIIPQLKAGNYFKANKDITAEQAEDYNYQVANNPFIISLMKGREDDRPIWKTDINMSSTTSYTTIQLSKLGRGLQQLHNIKIGDYSLADWFAIYNFIINKNQYGSDRLTKAFDVFLSTFNGKRYNIINTYLDYVGKIDYEGKDITELFDISIYDMLMQTARVVDNLETARGLMVIKDMKYYVKTGMNAGDYRYFGDVVDTNTAQTLKEQMDKHLIQRNYFVLSKPYSNYINRVKSMLDSKNPYRALSMLMQRGNITLLYDC